MKLWRHFTGRVPGHAPSLLPDVEVGIELKTPAVMVAQCETQVNDGPKRRSVGLVIQGSNVRLDAAEIDAPELIGDLIKAWNWATTE